MGPEGLRWVRVVVRVVRVVRAVRVVRERTAVTAPRWKRRLREVGRLGHGWTHGVVCHQRES